MSVGVKTFYSENSDFQIQVSYIYFLTGKTIYFPVNPVDAG